MTTEYGLKRAVGILSLMKFFPSDPDTRTALIELLAEMCHTDEQAIWLARRTTQLHNEWPGAHELRAILCSKLRPLDGIEVYSAIYPDGIPSETGRQEFEQLPAGGKLRQIAAPVDPVAAQALADVMAGVKGLPLPTVPTLEELDREVRERAAAERAPKPRIFERRESGEPITAEQIEEVRKKVGK